MTSGGKREGDAHADAAAVTPRGNTAERPEKVGRRTDANANRQVGLSQGDAADIPAPLCRFEELARAENRMRKLRG
jgi:hypothetical protein